MNPEPFEWICRHYGVPACYGRKVVIDGKPGIIVEDRGNYIGVTMDSDKPTVIRPYHPTHLVTYGDIGKPRKMTRSQQRYRDFLAVSECFEDFHHYLCYRASQNKKETYA